MKESNSKPEKQKEKPRFNQWQYKFLKLCSEKGDEGIARWNEWRKKHPDKDIWLQGKNFSDCYLERVFLNKGHFESQDGKIYSFTGEVHLESAIFHEAKLKKAIFHNARLQHTKFAKAHLEKAIFQGAHLQSANFYKARLYGANFKWVLLDNETSYIDIKIDNDTDFSCTGLDGVRIHPCTKQRLGHNIRRKNWEDWYTWRDWHLDEPQNKRSIVSRALHYAVRVFWWISDYGISTKRIIITFFGLAFVFALLYRLFPGFVMVYGKVGDIRGFWHALYFSVVTMTTLGFGDIAANPDSWAGQTFLMGQVILGYVLLGALVTRFAVLFTAGGPAGKFADEKEKEDKKK